MVNPAGPQLTIGIETWPIAGQFTISRGAKTQARVVVAELSDGRFRGRGECVPYARYRESPETVAARLQELAGAVAAGLTRDALQQALPPGAARNALDCAFWDFEAKQSATPVHVLAGLPPPGPLTTAFTISLGTPQAMAEAARAASARPLLKVKLGAEGDPERIAAIRAAVPATELIVDANEGWTADNLAENLRACAAAGVTLVEQPLPADADEPLRNIARPVPVCADESAHDRASLPALIGKYDAVNIKLDKTGGLTEALAMSAEAHSLGLMTMAGCMVATSLSMAPAMLIAQDTRVADLDGPLLLARDRPDGLVYDGSIVHPAKPQLWG
ncbi:N-acetyl-D-Glu racemase DgcA [Pseudorhodoplanes sp.]|uniref:N-acetyl-D-Glu racemase DgcA n=1 Tax=Pseudorhodoplanes sp. TaxID=1934341 RepID=UPI00391C3BD6